MLLGRWHKISEKLKNLSHVPCIFLNFFFTHEQKESIGAGYAYFFQKKFRRFLCFSYLCGAYRNKVFQP